ncbi:MAG TPA: hypothetical protein PLO61_05515 [Fimbriimonadaceae bacterium]|nr:hypothetical protein [Fimbriimonadaceae bacterium]HRJ33030.1 hypothetical protein [Fimbriimonadaceae bacterium]
MISSFLLGVALSAAPLHPSRTPETSMDPKQPPSTEITIYNGGFALVKEVRPITLKPGRQSIRIEDVAALIEPTSVGIRSLTKPGSLTVLEQSYQFDLINVEAILAKAVGQTIILNRVLPNGDKERIVGTLMSSPTAVVGSANGGSSMQYNGMVMRTNDGRILLNPSGEIEVQSIPEGLISKPTLLWDLVAEEAGSNTVELSYITQGTSWRADYVLTLDQAGGKGDLKSWVTLTNRSGATWTDAKLKLLAGEVERVQPPRAGMRGSPGGLEAASMADKGFNQEAFADYHLYTLQRPATVRNNEIKQVSLFEAVDVPVTKRLIVDPMMNMQGYRPSEGEVGTGLIKPQIRLELVNSKEQKLGMPFPQGVFKVFQRDSSGAVQLLGEDEIDHTPRDEKISLVVGRAFDIVAERKRTSFEWIRDPADRNRLRGARESFLIEIRNRKEKESETVTVIERFWAEHKIISHNVDFTRPNAETVQFEVTVKPGATQTIKFTVETTW